MDLPKLLIDFLEYLELERNVSKLTIRNYKHYMERFLLFLGANSPTPASITPDKIREYRLFLSRFYGSSRHDAQTCHAELSFDCPPVVSQISH